MNSENPETSEEGGKEDKYVHLIGRAKIEIIGADGNPIDQKTAPEKLRVSLFDSGNKAYPITFSGGLTLENIHLIAEFKNAGTEYDEALEKANSCLVKLKGEEEDIDCMTSTDPPCNTVA